MSTRSNEMVEAISATLVQQPFFACLLMDLLKIEETDAIPTAATNGNKIMVNPKFFKKLTVPERVFVLAHEVTHVILQHPGRMKAYHDMGVGPDLKEFSSKRFNIAADYIINAYLNDLKVGAQPLGTLLNGQFGQSDLADEVYLKIPEDEDDSENWDTHLPGDPNTVPTKGAIQRAVAAAAAAQKAMGKMPGGLQRLVDGILDPQVNWQEHLRSSIVTLHGSNESTWAHPNRRRLAAPPHIYWPGRCGTRTGRVGLVIDTSGSIGEAELKTFLSEVSGILNDCMPEMVYAMYVDARLHNDEVIEIEDVNQIPELGQKAGGGGGTNMMIGYSELRKRDLNVEYMIILTDGYTPFDPEDSDDLNVPTIWCITTDIVAPFGVTVPIKIASA